MAFKNLDYDQSWIDKLPPEMQADLPENIGDSDNAIILLQGPHNWKALQALDSDYWDSYRPDRYPCLMTQVWQYGNCGGDNYETRFIYPEHASRFLHMIEHDS